MFENAAQAKNNIYALRVGLALVKTLTIVLKAIQCDLVFPCPMSLFLQVCNECLWWE